MKVIIEQYNEDGTQTDKDNVFVNEKTNHTIL